MFFIGGDSPGTVETVFIVSGILLDLVSWHVWVYWYSNAAIKNDSTGVLVTD